MKKSFVVDPCSPSPMMTWIINDNCNFRCCYCGNTIKNAHQNTIGSAQYPIEYIVSSFHESAPTWKLLISGGEPFLYLDEYELQMLHKNYYFFARPCSAGSDFFCHELHRRCSEVQHSGEIHGKFTQEDICTLYLCETVSVS